jgi:hypothetical protein
MQACSSVGYFELPSWPARGGGDDDGGDGSTTEQHRSHRLGLVCHFASSLLLCGTVPKCSLAPGISVLPCGAKGECYHGCHETKHICQWKTPRSVGISAW